MQEVVIYGAGSPILVDIEESVHRTGVATPSRRCAKPTRGVFPVK
jgi:hypothetical protein